MAKRSIARSITVVGAMLLVLLSLLPTLPGCGAEVGDECSTNVECGRGRACDRSSDDGYCTVTPCEANTCPENSVCVEFKNRVTYCMALCDSNGDCRKNYHCDEETGPTGFCRQTDS